jgi:hypothetical protein
MRTVQAHVYLNADEKEEIRQRAFDERITESELMRRAIKEYLTTHKKKPGQ